MLPLLFLMLFNADSFFCQTVTDVKLHQEPYVFSNPNYPADLGWRDIRIEWNFKVERGAKVKVACEDIRMMQRMPWTDDCPYVFLSALDRNGERKVCNNSVYGFVHISDGDRLTIRAGSTPNGSGLFKCVARSTAEPAPFEFIQLHPNGRVKTIYVHGHRDEPLPYLDRLWAFESPKGTRMSFQCNLGISGMKPLCALNVLTFNNGVHDEEFCQGNVYTWFSKNNKAKLRMQLDNYGDGKLKCLVQAVTGPNPNEYENAESEEIDSSEHGVIQGPRKTSCRCGWTNKNRGRILMGVETRINEFPWMVHLDIVFEVNNQSWSTNCGASIITRRHVLTAAHCVVAMNVVAKPSNVQMVLAKHNHYKPTGKEITVGAKQIFVRDAYLKQKLSFQDIAVIFSEQTIDFNTPLVGPICIEREEYNVINRRIKIIGWGLTENYVNSPFLRKSKARVMDPLLCGGKAWDVCTTTTQGATCNGDSGGPLVWLDPETNMYAQISLVSRGTPMCRGEASYSTLVAYFYDWIQEIIRNTDPSASTCHKV